jgi:hypothetical protein
MILTQFFKKEPYSDDSVVWRYTDFSKFVDLLDSNCLFFSRLTVLRKLDPYEGSFILFGSHNGKDENAKKIFKELDRMLPSSTYVNCWYLSDIESAALWKLFPKSDEGIAIKSTVGRLTNSLESKNSHNTIYMSSVTYGHEKVKRRKTKTPKSYTGDDAVFTKRACFEHEKELRLVLYAHDLKTPVVGNDMGLKIGVDVESMISEVVISPVAPYWMEDLVSRVTKKYGFSFEVKQSNLNKLPF